MDLGLDEAEILQIEQHSLEKEKHASSCSRTVRRRRERSRSRSGDRWTPSVTYIHIHQCDTFSVNNHNPNLSTQLWIYARIDTIAKY